MSREQDRIAASVKPPTMTAGVLHPRVTSLRGRAIVRLSVLTRLLSGFFS